MKNLQVLAMVAGVFFGLWPIMMNRSGLNGNVASAMFSAVVFAMVLPFAIRSIGSMGNVNWYMAIGAGLVGSIGLMSFNAMLAKATSQNLGNLCVMMVLVQTAIPAIYQAVMTGSVTFNKGLGFGFAALAAWFLLL